MTPDRYERIKAIFLAAVAAPPADRGRVIAEACHGDDDLRGEVEKLLAHHQDGDPTIAPGTAAAAVRPTDIVPSPLSALANRLPLERGAGSDGFSPGTVIGDRYRIVAQLGRGGMGVVYRAEDLKLVQHVALKFLTSTLAHDPVWIARLREEVRIARSVTHPGVCRVYDIGEQDELHYLSMEYVEGEDLASLLRQVGALTREKALQLGRQICLGLHAAHHAGVVHRDLKPGNVLVDREGRARITDFGLAILPEQGGQHLRGGTPAYMAPEQLTGGAVTAQTDIYALGLVLYELLSGQPAITAGSIEELLDPQRRPKPRPLGSLVKDLPPGLEAVIERCLLPDPDERPASALLVAAELPGADVLAAALEAGETPTPDLIAAASPRLVAARWRIPLAVSSLVLLTLLVLTKATSRLPWDQVSSQPPAVMKDRGKQLLTSLGHDVPEYRGFGFCDPEELERLASEGFDKPGAMRLDPALGPFFWLRCAPSGLAPLSYENVMLRTGRTTLHDPPATPGSVFLAYDREGRLVFYREIPAAASAPGDSAPANSHGLDALLGASGLAPDAPISIEAVGSSVLSFAARPAHGRAPATARLRASNGRLLAFAVETTPTMPRESPAAAVRRQRVTTGAAAFLFLGLLVVTTPWAWHSYRSGHADQEGAVRLAVGVFAVALTVKVLRFPAGLGFTEGLEWLVVGAFYAAGAGALMAAFYLALDRHARKYWPDKLVTWTRAVNLRLWDPAVREHVLAGVGLGVWWGLLVATERRLVASMEWPVRRHLATDRITERLLGLRPLAAGLLDIVPPAVLYGLLFMLVLVVAQRLVAHRGRAAALALLVLVVALVPRGAHPYTSWAFHGIGGAGLCVWAMMRFGLLTLVAGLFVVMVLNTTPMTLNFGSWHADSMLLVLGLAAIGVLYGASAPRGAATKPPWR